MKQERLKRSDTEKRTGEKDQTRIRENREKRAEKQRQNKESRKSDIQE